MSKVDMNRNPKNRPEPKADTLEEANALIEKLRRVVASQAQRILELEKIVRAREHRLPVSKEGNA